MFSEGVMFRALDLVYWPPVTLVLSGAIRVPLAEGRDIYFFPPSSLQHAYCERVGHLRTKGRVLGLWRRRAVRGSRPGSKVKGHFDPLLPVGSHTFKTAVTVSPLSHALGGSLSHCTVDDYTSTGTCQYGRRSSGTHRSLSFCTTVSYYVLSAWYGFQPLWLHRNKHMVQLILYPFPPSLHLYLGPHCLSYGACGSCTPITCCSIW